MLDALRRLTPTRLRPKLHVVRLVQRKTRCQVYGGPFSGLKLGTDCQWLPGLLGLYERELWPIVEEIERTGFDRIVNIGAAAGYYAVGLARRMGSARVVAFEGDTVIQASLRRTIALNHVAARVEVCGYCTSDDLANVLQSGVGTLVLCDVEGFEVTLLNPAAVPALEKAAILVELHDHLVPDASALIRRRFERSHAIRKIWQTNRDAAEFPFMSPYLRVLPKSYRQWAVDEGRVADMHWFWMTPHATTL